jgi:hypothetical protein
MFVKNPNTPSGKPLLWRSAKSPEQVKAGTTDFKAAALAKRTPTGQTQSLLGSKTTK